MIFAEIAGGPRCGEVCMTDESARLLKWEDAPEQLYARTERVSPEKRGGNPVVVFQIQPAQKP